MRRAGPTQRDLGAISAHLVIVALGEAGKLGESFGDLGERRAQEWIRRPAVGKQLLDARGPASGHSRAQPKADIRDHLFGAEVHVVVRAPAPEQLPREYREREDVDLPRSG